MIKTHRILLGALSLAALAALAPGAKAQANTWEISAEGSYLTSSTTNFTANPNVSLKFTSIGGGGVGGAYNITDQLSATADIWEGTTDAKESAFGQTINLSSTTDLETVGLDWKFLKGPVTPYVGVNIGEIHYGSGVDETDFIYGGHIGVRYEFDAHWFGKIALQADGTQVQDTTKTMSLIGGVASFGYRF